MKFRVLPHLIFVLALLISTQLVTGSIEISTESIHKGGRASQESMVRNSNYQFQSQESEATNTQSQDANCKCEYTTVPASSNVSGLVHNGEVYSSNSRGSSGYHSGDKYIAITWERPWVNADKVATYCIERRALTELDYQYVATVDNNTWFYNDTSIQLKPLWTTDTPVQYPINSFLFHTPYSYRVFALNSNGEVTGSGYTTESGRGGLIRRDAIYATATPNQPVENLRVVEDGNTTIVSWKKPNTRLTIKYYEVKIIAWTLGSSGAEALDRSSRTTISKTATRFIHSNPLLRNSYTYRITPIYDSQPPIDSYSRPYTVLSPFNGIIVTDLPQAVYNLQSVSGDNYVSLFWNVPLQQGRSPVTKYQILRAAGDDPFTLLTETSLFHYNDTSVQNGVRYNYQIYAFNEAGKSEKFSTRNTVPGKTPEKPNSFQATTMATSILLTWEAPNEDGGSVVTKYYLYRATYPEGPYSRIKITDKLTHEDKLISASQPFYYRIYAINEVGVSEEFATAEAEIVPNLKIENLQATVNNERVFLSWEKPQAESIEKLQCTTNFASLFEIHRSIVLPQLQPQFIGSTTHAVFVDPTVEPNTEYQYYVVAVDATGTNKIIGSSIIIKTPGTIVRDPEIIPTAPISPEITVDIIKNGEIILETQIEGSIVQDAPIAQSTPKVASDEVVDETSSNTVAEPITVGKIEISPEKVLVIVSDSSSEVAPGSSVLYVAPDRIAIPEGNFQPVTAPIYSKETHKPADVATQNIAVEILKAIGLIIVISASLFGFVVVHSKSKQSEQLHFFKRIFKSQ